MLSASEYPLLRRRLLQWFRKNARPLPWRASRDPYAIWISEVMLQQTQVATVIPYFERFLKQFPDVQSLADADEQTVLRFWEGLGYYRRARGLCQAARQLVHAGHKTIPDDAAFVHSLPGFGRYTTNAVLSQAFEQRLPILEANSQRVLCRLFGIDSDPKQNATQKVLWQLADDLLPKKSAGDFNQALMELGALVCKLAKPDCERCPLSLHCEARRQNREEELPRRPSPPKIVTVAEVAVIVRKRNQVLLVQRGDGGRWENMWEFPHHEVTDDETIDDAACRLLSLLGIEAEPMGELCAIEHSVTRFCITLTCVVFAYRRGKALSADHQNIAWLPVNKLHDYPLSTPQRRLARMIMQ